MSVDHEDRDAGGEPGAQGRVVRAAGVVGLATLASRILGLVRDVVIAAFFAKRSTDSFFVAFTIPNVFRRLLAEGALTVAFIPVYTEYQRKQGQEAARVFLAKTLGPVLALLLFVCGLGIWAAPAVVKLFAYGLTGDPDRMQLAILLTRLLFPFLFSVGLVALAMGVLNSHDHFVAPAIAPVLLNASIIVTVMVLGRRIGAWGLPPVSAIAVGVLVGGLAQIVLQLPPLMSRGLLPRPRWGPEHPGVRRVAKLLLPSVFGLAVYQVHVMLSRQFASFLPAGSISYLYYAQRLIEFPIGIFATAMATVSMPRLAAQVADGKMDDLKATYRYTLQLVLFLLLPATAGLVALSEPLITVIFQRGAFSYPMARETAFTLVGFALGLCAAGGVRQTVPVFYALHDMRTPVKVSALALLVYGACAWVLFRPLGTVGLSISVTVATSVHFLTLMFLLRRRLGPLGLRAVGASGLRSLLAAVLCGAVAWTVALGGSWARGGAVGLNYVILALAVAFGGVVYVGATRVMGSQELAELATAVRRRGRR